MNAVMKSLLMCGYIMYFFGQAKAQPVFDPLFLDEIVCHEQMAGEAKFHFKLSSETDNYDLTYMRAEWNVDPEVYNISGTIVYYLVPRTGDLAEVVFDLSDSMQVNSFKYQGIISTDFERVNNQLILHLPFPMLQDAEDSVEISYEGEPVASGLGSFIQGGHNGDSIIYTLSEPYGASDWFPCKNSLTDKIDSLDIIVYIPPECKLGSIGELVEDTVISGMFRKMHWRSGYPIATYLIGITVTDYAELIEICPLPSGDTVEILEYLYPEDSATYVEFPGMIVESMQLFSELFGDYPFKEEKYGQAQWNYGGGMEHQTMSFVGANNNFELAAHELAHQWFGDKITCGSWQHIWLNEGFATYLSGLCYENLQPQYWMAFLDTRRSGALKDSTGSVFCEDTTDVSRIFSSSLSYSKASYVLHMLRWKMGDEVFFDAVYNYINDLSLAYGFAFTDDLKKNLEDKSGLDLTEFFSDWVYGKGYPSYHIKWANNSDGTISLALRQTQNNPAVSFFEMPLPIQLKNAEHDTIIRIQNDFNDQNFVIGPFSFVPDTLKFDPDLWILTTRNTVTYDALVAETLVIFPNPVHDVLQISYHAPDAITEISIYDVTGRKLSTMDASSFLFYDPFSLNISSYSAGYYFLEVKTTQDTFIGKFVKR